MESGPAFFAGVVFSLFGAGVLGWVGWCWRSGVPVVAGAGRGAGRWYAGLGALTLAVGIWCLACV